MRRSLAVARRQGVGSAEKALQLGVAIDRTAPRVRSINVFGHDTSVRQTLPSVGLGRLELRDVEILIQLRGESGYRHSRLGQVEDTTVGTALLRRFRVRIDYLHKTLGLLPAVRTSDVDAIH